MNAADDIDVTQAEPPGRLTESKASLDELLEETRILLPGTEVLVAFLIGLPFTERFDQLTSAERIVFVFTFFAAVVAMICFIAPAAYHRQARPIHDKAAFKQLANRFLVVGMAPLSLSLSFASYLLASMVVSTPFAFAASGLIAASILTLWWVLPYVRAHEGVRPRRIAAPKVKADGASRSA